VWPGAIAGFALVALWGFAVIALAMRRRAVARNAA